MEAFEGQVHEYLDQRYSLKMHGFALGFFTLSCMLFVSWALLRLGVTSLALRYFLALGLGYGVYLVVLRWWATHLVVRQDAAEQCDALEAVVDAGLDVAVNVGEPILRNLTPVRLPNVPPSPAASGLGDAFSGTLDAVGSLDEGAVVAVPVLGAFVIVVALLSSIGTFFLLFFGWEALLTVAVELAFSYVSSRAALRLVRQGWLTAALRLTYKPMLGATVCAVALGAAIDHWVPTAYTLLQAVQVITAQ